VGFTIDHYAGSQAATAKASHSLNSEHAILAGFSFFGVGNLGQSLSHHFGTTQVTGSAVTDLNQVFAWGLEPKLGVEGDYAKHLTNRDIRVIGYALYSYWRYIAIDGLNLLEDGYYCPGFYIVFMDYGINHGETGFLPGVSFNNHAISFGLVFCINP